ncbi:MAG: menaquinol-cytochrome c reductase cytochrome b subunit [Acidimicrobiia bacterium]
MAEIPEHLLRRSAEAKAKALGVPVEQVLAEMLGEAAPAAASEAAPATAAPRAPTAPAPTTPAPTTPAIPEGVRTQRLLTVVKAKAIQGVKREPTDKVSVWPHLLAIEFVALLAVTALLIIFSVFQDAPLLELANPNEQPNPSKAPWYFLGLQELLSYFDPQVAGVLIPGLGLAGLAIIPFVDRNKSTRPADRKFAITIFTFFVIAAAILTMIGSFYRGKGFNFTFPWRDGIFFDL